jgi:hypothetical protein
MKTLTVRVPDRLAAQIESEARTRRVSKSDIVRERLNGVDHSPEGMPSSYQDIADLIGSVDGLPSDLAARKKYYLKATGYGRKRHR